MRRRKISSPAEETTREKSNSSFFSKHVVQSKLQVNTPGDNYEREADTMADHVMDTSSNSPAQAPFFKPAISGIQRKCQHCEEEEKLIHRKESTGTNLQQSDHLDNYVSSLGSSGTPLPEASRKFFEPRFGQDFSAVRVHDDPSAARSAQSVNALAYTTGNNIVFNTGQYSPGSDTGKHLIAHELTHIVQQSAVKPANKVQRATVDVNGQHVKVDFNPVFNETNYLNGVIAGIKNYTGTAPDAATVKLIEALSQSKQRWLMYALDLLIDNTSAAQASLDRSAVVKRLIQYAPASVTNPWGADKSQAQSFAKEVLVFSGWTDATLTANLKAPDADAKKIISPIINPVPDGGITGKLDAIALQKRLVKAFDKLFAVQDPGLIKNPGQQSITDIGAIGNIIFKEARNFFKPYADASGASVLNLKATWVPSANISSTTALTPDHDARIDYLYNRAQELGWNTQSGTIIEDQNIFSEVNFNGKRDDDNNVLMGILEDMLKDAGNRGIVDRLIQHTGFKTGSGISTRVSVNPEYDTAKSTACAARWETIHILCHEILHALVNPDFQAASGTVGFPQVISEGFAEVLGWQLFNEGVLPKAGSDKAFKASLEVGITGKCDLPDKADIGYQSAGAGAETIRTTVHDDNFRAAYFLGRTNLIGI